MKLRWRHFRCYVCKWALNIYCSSFLAKWNENLMPRYFSPCVKCCPYLECIPVSNLSTLNSIATKVSKLLLSEYWTIWIEVAFWVGLGHTIIEILHEPLLRIKYLNNRQNRWMTKVFCHPGSKIAFHSFTNGITNTGGSLSIVVIEWSKSICRISDNVNIAKVVQWHSKVIQR